MPRIRVDRMIKITRTFKSNQTIYFEYDYSYISLDKPDGKKGEDYDLARKGTLFYARKLEDEEMYGVDEKYHIILEANNGQYIYFEHMKDAYSCEFLEVIKE